MTAHRLFGSAVLVTMICGSATAQCESQLAKLAPSGVGADANSGVSVAIDGDTLAVGSPNADFNGTNSGAVFVYRRTNGVWAQEAVLTYGNAGWWLGWSVAISGDTIIAGAPGVPRGGGSFGGVFEFRRAGGAWSLAQGYTNGVDGIGYYTGTSCAISGNIMIFGSQLVSSSSGWSFTFTRDNPTAPFVFRYGFSGGSLVATDGLQVATTGPGYGGVIVMRRPANDNWTLVQQEVANLSGPDTFANANSLAIQNRTIVVGAPGFDTPDGHVNSGAVYVFEHLTQSLQWIPTLRIIDPDNTDQDLFGWSVAFDSVNPDRFAVGSVWANVGGAADAGAVFVYERNGASEWQQIRREVALDADAGDELGRCVSMSGGFVAAGAPSDDQQALNSGTAYVFSVDPQRPVIGGGPNDASVRVGQTAVFSVTAGGAGSFTYQWRRSGIPLADGGRIAGSRTASLRLRNCRWVDAATYDCVVSNGCGSTTSAPATLTVICPADFNDDSFLDFFDYDDFITAFERGDPRSDFNQDGFIDFFDYDDFVAGFEAGC